MKTTGRWIVLALVLAAACHHDKKPTTTPVATDNTPPPTKQDKPAPQVTQDQKVSNSLALAGDLAAMCNIKPTASAVDPKFDYDKDELSADDRNVLDQLAQCLISGAAKGKAIALIGRADPRGTEEYNLGLGSRRASSVSKYLSHLGVQDPQLAVTTRGALDATGTDEAGWANDRRVDVQLKQD
ncbi:MAG TPA: OmpA family protein [Kofleriaceae bacterium]|jgi:peptidoglycan-associated lipoprotein